jgi:hypothetical protein
MWWGVGWLGFSAATGHTRTVSKQQLAACLVGEVGNCEALQDSHTCLFTTTFRYCMTLHSICSFHAYDASIQHVTRVAPPNDACPSST